MMPIAVVLVFASLIGAGLFFAAGYVAARPRGDSVVIDPVSLTDPLKRSVADDPSVFDDDHRSLSEALQQLATHEGSVSAALFDDEGLLISAVGEAFDPRAGAIASQAARFARTTSKMSQSPAEFRFADDRGPLHARVLPRGTTISVLLTRASANAGPAGRADTRLAALLMKPPW